MTAPQQIEKTDPKAARRMRWIVLAVSGIGLAALVGVLWWGANALPNCEIAHKLFS